MQLEDIRQFYAEEISAVANIRSPALVSAFAKVPREKFLGPGPWQIPTPETWQAISPAVTKGVTRYRTTPDANPRHLYHNVLVAIDADRNLNNGQPSMLAWLIEALDLKEGDHVVHVGCAVGYYTAIIAEVVGPRGKVVAIELDPKLAGLAHKNLAYLRQVEVVQADGGTHDSGYADAIFVNAGATHLRPLWLDSLPSGGRLLVPLTTAKDEEATGMGFILKVVREEAGYSARFISPVMIFPCIGSRDAKSNQRLREAMMKGTWGNVRSLRRDPHETSDTCWLHGDRFCLSTRVVTGGSV